MKFLIYSYTLMVNRINSKQILAIICNSWVKELSTWNTFHTNKNKNTLHAQKVKSSAKAESSRTIVLKPAKVRPVLGRINNVFSRIWTTRLFGNHSKRHILPLPDPNKYSPWSSADFQCIFPSRKVNSSFWLILTMSAYTIEPLS